MSNSKKPRLDVMIDLETFSENVHVGMVVSCAVVPFRHDKIGDDHAHTLIEGESFPSPMMVYIDTASSVGYGRFRSTETMAFWAKHPVQYDAMMNEYVKWKMSFPEAWGKVHAYLSQLCERFNVWVWSQGTDFDFPMMEGCFKQLHYTPPYKFYQKMDARTVCKLAEQLGWPKPDKKPKHDALDDCIAQIKNVKAAFAFLYAATHLRLPD